jgi:hypothetical protein
LKGYDLFYSHSPETIKKQRIQTLMETNADQGYRELLESAQKALNALESTDTHYYLVEVYDDSLVFEKYGNGEEGGAKLYKQGYQYADEVFALLETPKEVKRKVEYVSVNTMYRTKFNLKKEEVSKMAEKVECTPCVKKKVDELIANSQGKYTEAHREQLETLSIDVLELMATPIVKEVEKVVEKTVTISDYSAEDKAALAAYKKQLKETRDNLIKSIQVNTSVEAWPTAELETMSDDILKRMLNSVKKEETAETDFSLNVSNFSVNKADDEPLYPAGVTVVKK